MRAHGSSGWRWSGQDQSADAYRRLGVRVIDRALRDIIASPGSGSNRQSARLFLAGSPMLHLWCQLAALDPARVAAHAGRLTKRSRFGRPMRGLGRYGRAGQIKSES